MNNQKVVGIIIAKENSNRFPGKNYYQYKDKPLYMHNFDLLYNCPAIDIVYVATNSEKIKHDFKNFPMAVIDRKINISGDDQPFLDVLKFAYYSLPERYDIIISILANTINHTMQAVSESLFMIMNTDLNEIRSYNTRGEENGILVFREKVLMQHEISSHMGMVISEDAKEIHYKEELEDCL